MIIGITGGTGSGKTTLLHVVKQLGGVVIDCDAVYHDLLCTDKDLLNAIENRFPGTVEDGVLQRKRLGSLVFSDPDALQDLNHLTHGAVKTEVIRLLTPEPTLAAIDAIGLFESGLSELCKLTIAVTAPDELRMERLMTRDGITREYAKARIAAQRSQEEFSALCDYTFVNDRSAADFEETCFQFFEKLGIMKP